MDSSGTVLDAAHRTFSVNSIVPLFKKVVKRRDKSHFHLELLYMTLPQLATVLARSSRSLQLVPLKTPHSVKECQIISRRWLDVCEFELLKQEKS